MARVRNHENYTDSYERLINAGLDLLRSKSFDGVGIGEILEAASVPKGSFYHYFKSKDDFGLAVADIYHEELMDMARQHLSVETVPPFENLRTFFEAAAEEFRLREYSDGCLMVNLSSELADQKGAFQQQLAGHWQALTELIAAHMDRACVEQIGLDHLSRQEAADLLINSWSGALTRMKAERSESPLRLFLKTHFERGE
uniref:TetR/AcrR family transcriptional regulator n=1 Tax=uncultured Altererythrobacter sp. TaxID=500840 RepID=UPI0026294459|nr:TetR/AcrR family transcriptional regulator [uncultured Altererythrobacter sp.]